MRNGDQNTQPDEAGRDAAALTPPELPGISLTTPALSRGPYSAVYRGWDRTHRHDVIVKVLQTGGDPVAADRFRREASVMAKLRHPNIVALYSFHDGDPSALIMEYVPGQTLDALIAADGPLPAARAVQIIEGIAAGLDLIHAENIVHRDVKPTNILLPKHGPARLTDFGVAHINTSTPLTVHGDMLGTIEYASPEQVQGTGVPDARSDVYSLAAVAYFALTGTPPFPAADSSMQSHLSVMHQQVFSEPPTLRSRRADIAPGVDAAVRRGLAKDPAARYPSAGQFASALRSAVVAASGAPEQGAVAASSRRTFALTGALAGAAVLAGGAALLWSHEQSAPALTSPHSVQQIAAVPPASSTPAAPTSAVKPPLAAKMPPKAAPLLKAKPQADHVAALPLPRVLPLHRALPAAAARHAPVYHAPAHHAPLVAHALPAAPEPRYAAPMRVAKRAVTERPKYRRHPALIASRERPSLSSLAKPKHLSTVFLASSAAKLRPAPSVAWLSVFARQDVVSPGGHAQTEAIPAQEVTVDGRPLPALTHGGWASVPAGRHLVAFAPSAASGFGRSPGLWITLAPGAHVSRQVLLPAASLILATTRTGAPLLAAVSPVSVPPAVPAPALEPQAALQPPVAPPQVVADVPQAAPTAPAVGWYTVSGWIVRNPAAPKPTLVRTSAYWVKVDGTPNPALALGQWAELPAGKHTIEFQPTNGVGVGAKTWDIDLSPQGHLDQQIPLPPMVVTPN